MTKGKGDRSCCVAEYANKADVADFASRAGIAECAQICLSPPVPYDPPKYVWYVAKNGVDGLPNNGSEWAPFASVRYAITVAVTTYGATASQVIQIAPGTYSENNQALTISTSGNISLIAEDPTDGATNIPNGIVFQPATATTSAQISGLTIGSLTLASTAFAYAPLSVSSGYTLSFEKCFLRNGAAATSSTVSVSQYGTVSFTQCTIESNAVADENSYALLKLNTGATVSAIRECKFKATGASVSSAALPCLVVAGNATVERVYQTNFTTDGALTATTASGTIVLQGSAGAYAAVLSIDGCKVTYSQCGLCGLAYGLVVSVTNTQFVVGDSPNILVGSNTSAVALGGGSLVGGNPEDLTNFNGTGFDNCLFEYVNAGVTMTDSGTTVSNFNNCVFQLIGTYIASTVGLSLVSSSYIAGSVTNCRFVDYVLSGLYLSASTIGGNVSDCTFLMSTNQTTTTTNAVGITMVDGAELFGIVCDTTIQYTLTGISIVGDGDNTPSVIGGIEGVQLVVNPNEVTSVTSGSGIVLNYATVTGNILNATISYQQYGINIGSSLVQGNISDVTLTYSGDGTTITDAAINLNAEISDVAIEGNLSNIQATYHSFGLFTSQTTNFEVQLAKLTASTFTLDSSSTYVADSAVILLCDKLTIDEISDVNATFTSNGLIMNGSATLGSLLGTKLLDINTGTTQRGQTRACLRMNASSIISSVISNCAFHHTEYGIEQTENSQIGIQTGGVNQGGIISNCEFTRIDFPAADGADAPACIKQSSGGTISGPIVGCTFKYSEYGVYFTNSAESIRSCYFEWFTTTNLPPYLNNAAVYDNDSLRDGIFSCVFYYNQYGLYVLDGAQEYTIATNNFTHVGTLPTSDDPVISASIAMVDEATPSAATTAYNVVGCQFNYYNYGIYCLGFQNTSTTMVVDSCLFYAQSSTSDAAVYLTYNAANSNRGSTLQTFTNNVVNYNTYGLVLDANCTVETISSNTFFLLSEGLSATDAAILLQYTSTAEPAIQTPVVATVIGNHIQYGSFGMNIANGKVRTIQGNKINLSPNSQLATGIGILINQDAIDLTTETSVVNSITGNYIVGQNAAVQTATTDSVLNSLCDNFLSSSLPGQVGPPIVIFAVVDLAHLCTSTPNNSMTIQNNRIFYTGSDTTYNYGIYLRADPTPPTPPTPPPVYNFYVLCNTFSLSASAYAIGAVNTTQVAVYTGFETSSGLNTPSNAIVFGQKGAFAALYFAYANAI